MKHYQRQSLRLRDYDYRHEGAYFVTICAHRHSCMFGEIQQAKVHLATLGQLVESAWNVIPQHFPHIELDAAVVMPNHFHGILVIKDNRFIPDESGVGAQYIAPKVGITPHNVSKGSLGTIVRSFKAAVTRDFRRVNKSHSPIWQRNYYEHIIRNEKSLNYIRYYIATNPEVWANDVLRNEESAQQWYARFAKSH